MTNSHSCYGAEMQPSSTRSIVQALSGARQAGINSPLRSHKNSVKCPRDPDSPPVASFCIDSPARRNAGRRIAGSRGLADRLVNTNCRSPIFAMQGSACTRRIETTRIFFRGHAARALNLVPLPVFGELRARAGADLLSGASLKVEAANHLRGYSTDSRGTACS